MKHKIEIIGKILYHNPKKKQEAPNSITLECELGDRYPARLKIDFWNGVSIDDFKVGDLVIVFLNNAYEDKKHKDKDGNLTTKFKMIGEYIEKIDNKQDYNYQTKKTPEKSEIIDEEIPF